MNQDINAKDSLAGFTPTPGLNILPFNSAQAASSTPALGPDVRLSNIEDLTDWIGTDLKTDSARAENLSPDQLRAKRAIEAAIEEAELETGRFALNREWKIAKQNLQTVRAKEFATSAECAAAVDEAKATLAAADEELRKLGSPKYAKTTKALRNYANAVLDLAEKSSEGERQDIARKAVIDLESRLMPKVDNIYMGVNGRMEGLARIQLKQPFDAIARLHALERHLHSRSLHIDMDQEARVQSVANNPTVRGMLERGHELPKDGAIFFLRGSNMVRAGGSSIPIMIDVPRLALGLGKEGAGLFRFIGQETEIDGAVVIRLKLKNGKPIPLKGSDPANPKYAKEVCELVGASPEWLKVGMTFGEVVKRFGLARQESSSENAEKSI
ncbi:MAG TPA: hypothetical protein V6C69_22535 [Trichormus sp.]